LLKAAGTSSTPELARLPISISPTGVSGGQDQMQVRKIDFAKLDRLITRADAELRETEDALISFIEQQQKRDRLYSKSQEELKERFQFGRMGGVA
jgi:hypothetical protein